jgi:uncharacterized protein
MSSRTLAVRQRRIVSLFAWALGFVCLYGALALAAFLGQRALMYPAPSGATTEPNATGLVLERIASEHGTVFALHARAPEGAPTLVFFHGNGEDLTDLPELVKAFAVARVGCYAVEYPGYGLMRTQAPSEAALYAAAQAALDHLRAALGVPVASTVLVGQSLGSGVAAEMARRGLGARLVLLSPFTSMTDMAARIAPILPARLLIRDRYDTRSNAPAIALPALVIHGTDDEVVPFAMGQRVAELLPNGRLRTVPGARHNDLFARAPELIVEIAGFARGDQPRSG